jgi:DNA-binding PadR family transcriptional regulator
VLELAILGLLHEQPGHGYELKQRLSETLGSFWGISFGSLYPALHRLERSGAIEVVDAGVPAPPNRRPRKAYRITPFGQEQLLALLSSDDGGNDERLFSLKLAFCRFLDPAARLVLLKRRRAELTDRLARARRTRGPPVDRYTRSLVEHRTRSTERDLEWIDDLIATEDQSPDGGGPSTPGRPTR